MITVLTGDNDFEVREALSAIEAAFTGGTAERIDGASLTLANIPDLLMGVSLFATERLVVIDGLSGSSAVWSKLSDWLPRVSDAVHLVLIEQALDKRTSTYKALKAVADIQTFAAWTAKDRVQAEAWVVHYAQAQGVTLSRQAAAHLVARAGYDQWQLSQAVAMLALVGEDREITAAVIDAIVVPTTEENVFQLLDDALSGRAEAVTETIKGLTLTEEPHRLMALIVSQVMSLAAAVLAPDTADPAKDFGIHPFALSKLRRFRSSLGQGGALAIVKLTAQADVDLKSSRGEPWLIVERLLIQIAHKTF